MPYLFLYPRNIKPCFNTKACPEIFTVILFLVDMTYKVKPSNAHIEVNELTANEA